MKKNHFINLIACVTSGLLFSLGVCMCLIKDWDLFTLGVIFTCVGGVILLTIGITAYIKTLADKSPINWKLVGKILYAIFSTLLFGLSLCMILVWDLIAGGIILGILAIFMLLCLIPMFLGFKK